MDVETGEAEVGADSAGVPEDRVAAHERGVLGLDVQVDADLAPALGELVRDHGADGHLPVVDRVPISDPTEGARLEHQTQAPVALGGLCHVGA